MIKTILYPTLAMDVLRLEMTAEDEVRFDSLSPDEKAAFVYKNLSDEEQQHTYRELITDMSASGTLYQFTLQKGICRECGCTEHDACYHPTHGCCSWADENWNLCSHCAEKEIAEDPLTVRPAGVKKAVW